MTSAARGGHQSIETPLQANSCWHHYGKAWGKRQDTQTRHLLTGREERGSQLVLPNPPPVAVVVLAGGDYVILPISRFMTADGSVPSCEESCMDRALHYLGYQARTVSEIDSYLRRKEFGEAAINVTLRRLQEMGYLDDTAFARNYVMSRMRSTSASRLKMRMDLARRGVDKEIVEDEIRRIPLEYDVEAAKLLARKRWERLSSCDDRVRAQKVMAYLVRRGFSYEVAKSALTRVEDGEDHDD